MLTEIFLLLSCGPPLTDLKHFPAEYTCSAQIRLYRLQEAKMRGMRGICGWEGGRWDDWEADCVYYRRCWCLLEAAYQTWLLPDEYRRVCLRKYKELVGPYRYLKRWSPPQLPETMSEVYPDNP